MLLKPVRSVIMIVVLRRTDCLVLMLIIFCIMLYSTGRTYRFMYKVVMRLLCVFVLDAVMQILSLKCFKNIFACVIVFENVNGTYVSTFNNKDMSKLL